MAGAGGDQLAGDGELIRQGMPARHPTTRRFAMAVSEWPSDD